MVVADTFARALGAVGTAGTVVLAVVGYLAYRRDRPRLELRLGLGVTEDGFALEVNVVNDGRYPVTLSGVVAGDGPPAGPDRSKPLRPTRHWLLRRLPAQPRSWLVPIVRLLADGVLEGDPVVAGGWVGPTLAVGASELTEPVLLAPGDARTFSFTHAQLSALGTQSVLYVAAIDVLERVARERVPEGILRLVASPGT